MDERPKLTRLNTGSYLISYNIVKTFRKGEY